MSSFFLSSLTIIVSFASIFWCKKSRDSISSVMIFIIVYLGGGPLGFSNKSSIRPMSKFDYKFYSKF